MHGIQYNARDGRPRSWHQLDSRPFDGNMPPVVDYNLRDCQERSTPLIVEKIAFGERPVQRDALQHVYFFVGLCDPIVLSVQTNNTDATEVVGDVFQSFSASEFIDTVVPQPSSFPLGLVVGLLPPPQVSASLLLGSPMPLRRS